LAGRLKIHEDPAFREGKFSIVGLMVEGSVHEGNWVTLPSSKGSAVRSQIGRVLIGMARDAHGMPYTPYSLELPEMQPSEGNWLRAHLRIGQLLIITDTDAPPLEPTPEAPPGSWWRRLLGS
jgi:hypothetical protein